MESVEGTVDRRALRQAWERLCSSGTATKTAAYLLKVGIEPYIDAFSERYLGPDGLGQGFKLVLGMNGEGKTHFLLALREAALRAGHVVSLVEPRSSGGIDSEFDFARELLRRMECPGIDEDDSGELRMLRLVRTAVERKRARAVEKGLDPDAILTRWASGVRMKDLHPHGLASALATALEAAIADDDAKLREAISKITFEEVTLTKAQARTQGSALLRSIPLLVKVLDFLPPVILLDEAETAVQRRGSARRKEFLQFLRFLNDHLANAAGDREGALVCIACTDDFWPDQFNEYEALRQRLDDPGANSYEERQMRADLSTKARVRMNKLWVRETFPGNESDYDLLGDELIKFASRVHKNLDVAVQTSNARRLGRVASSNSVRQHVKRNFVKALAGIIEKQIIDEKQEVISEEEAKRVFDVAVNEILEKDAE
jgi:hypothetical protein